MQITLFDNNSVNRKIELRINSIMTRPFRFDENLNVNEFYEKCKSITKNDVEFLESIEDGLKYPREYKIFMGSAIDSHFNLYASKTYYKSGEYVVVYSMQDLLPMILSIISKCDLSPLSNMKDIDVISKDLLEMYFESGVSLIDFIMADDKLAEYIKVMGEGIKDEQSMLISFMINVNHLMTRMLKYLAVYLETYSNLVFVTMDKSKILFRSQRKDVEDLECSIGRFKFNLKPLVLGDNFDYFKNYKSFKFGEIVTC